MSIYLNLKAFLSTVDFGSFSEAARSLDVAPSVVRHRVTQLEHHLRARLFSRSTRRLVLTEAGQNLLLHARQATAEIDELVAQARGRGNRLEDVIRVKVPTSLVVPAFHAGLAAFQASHPKVRLDVKVMDNPADPSVEGFDVAINIFPRAFAGSVDVHLGFVQRVLCASPSYIEVRGAPKTPRELPRRDCVSFSASLNLWTFKGADGNIEVQVRPRLESNNQPLLIEAASRGIGLFLAAKHLVAEKVARGELAIVMEDYPVADLAIRASIPSRRYQAPAVAAFVAQLQVIFRQSGLLAADME